VKKTLLVLLFVVLGAAQAQAFYVGLSTGSPYVNEDFKAGAHLGVALSPSLELRVSAEGSLRDARPEMASLDVLVPVYYFTTDNINVRASAEPNTLTHSNIYLGAGIDGYYRQSARRLTDVRRFGVHGVVGAEAMLGRIGLFGELQPGVVAPPNFNNPRGSFRGRFGFNFHL
jgi:hypothetical protein